MRIMTFCFLRRVFVLAMGLGVFLPGMMAARSLTSGADFLLVSPGARPSAMGGAFSALADDLNALNFNSAGLALLTQAEVGYARFQCVSDIHYDFLAGAMPIRNVGVFALGYLGMGMEPFDSTGDPAEAAVSATDMAILLGWGRTWTPWLKAGAEVKIIHRKVSDVTGTGFAADLSLLLNPVERVAVAVGVQNLGPDITLSVKEPLPTLGRLGVKVDVVNERDHRAAWTGEMSMTFKGRRPVYGTGAEYWYQSMAAARVGYVGNEEGQGVALGAGIRLKGFQIDYAFQPYDKTGSTHRFSGIYRFETVAKAAASKVIAQGRTAPKDLKTETMDRGVKVSWSPSGGEVASYELKVARANQVGKTVSGVKATSVLLKDLMSGEVYTVAVREMDDTGLRGPFSSTLRFQAP